MPRGRPRGRIRATSALNSKPFLLCSKHQDVTLTNSKENQRPLRLPTQAIQNKTMIPPPNHLKPRSKLIHPVKTRTNLKSQMASLSDPLHHPKFLANDV